jgi:hypothetical protein
MTLADIARAADVPVESVLRVLNRDEVNSDVAARVLEAMERYGYGQLPRRVTGEVVGDGPPDPADAVGRVREQLLDAVGDVVDELEHPGSGDPERVAASAHVLADRVAVMDALLHRLTHDVDELKRELTRSRHERLEDLTLLVDLITTSWRAVDRRLGRIDRKLERLEGPPRLPGRDPLP